MRSQQGTYQQCELVFMDPIAIPQVISQEFSGLKIINWSRLFCIVSKHGFPLNAKETVGDF